MNGYIEFKRVRCKPTAEITICDVTSRYEQIGIGSYCMAWESVDNRGSVLLFVNAADQSKAIIADALCGDFAAATHLPVMDFVGQFRNDHVYRTIRYNRLTSKDKIAWRQFNELRDMWRGVWCHGGLEAMCDKTLYAYRDMLDQFNTLVEARKDMPLSLRRAIDSLVWHSSNYAPHTIDIGRSNVAVDRDGNLILLDILAPVVVGTQKFAKRI